MNEPQPKRRRKRKTMARDDTEIDDDYDEIIRLQNSVQEVSSMMKAMTANNFKQANRHFAVDITVEEVIEEQQAIDKPTDKDVYKFESKQIIIDKKRMWQVLESISKEVTDYADRLLAVEVGNTWGRLETEIFQESKKEMAIQEALCEWQTWLHANKSKFFWTKTPTSYKCYVCSKGWWRLYQFKEHIETHGDELKISVETTSVDCNMIAFIGDKPATKVVTIYGDGLKCSKDIKEHGKNQCKLCLTIFAYCSALYRHNCIEIRRSRGDIVGPDIWDDCPICGYKCKASDMNNHRLLKHRVPSDEPVDFFAKKHKTCGMKYVCQDTHACPAEMRQIYCNYCPRKFHNVLLSKLHMDISDFSVKCQICSELLPRQCMLMEHLSAHSKHFAMVPKCAICTVPVVFPDEVSAKHHMKECHDKIETRNKTYHDMVIIPKVIVQKWRNTDLMDSSPIYKQEDAVTDNDKTNEDSKKIINGANLYDYCIKSVEDSKSTNISTNNKNSESSNSTHNDINDEYSELVIDEPDYDDDDDLILLNDSVCRQDNVVMEVIDISDSEDDTHNINHETERNDGVELVQQISEACGTREISVGNNVNIKKVDPEVYVKKSQESVEVTSDNLKMTNEDSQNKEEIGVDGEDKERIVENETGVRVDLSVIKQEVDDEFHLQVDEDQYYIDDLDVKKESDVCNDVLTHIFEASKLKNRFEADDDTNIGVIIKTEIKEEPKPKDEIRCDVASNVLNGNKKTCVRNLKTNARVNKSGLVQKMKWKLLQRSVKKIYSCRKCLFQGYHREYAQHIEDCHPNRRKYRRRRRDNTAVLKSVEIKMHGLASEDMYNCTKCLRKFESFHGYVDHFVSHDINPNTCPLCESTYENVVLLCNHIRNFHIEKSFVALRTINHEENPPVPEKEGHKGKTKIFKCLVCENKVLRSHFFIHWENHFGFKVSKQHLDMMSLDIAAEDRKVENALSAEVLKTLKDALMGKMDELQRKSHNKAKKGVTRRNCVICSKDFDRTSDWKRHLIEHLLSDAYATYGLYEAFRCQFCRENFEKVDWYKQHMRNHGNLPVYQCELCNKMFSDSSNFAKHKKIHNLKVYVCNLCKRKFQAKISLEKHLQDHDKPVTCKLCHKIFPLNFNYKRHLKHAHEKVLLKYMCPICKKRFESCKLKWDHMWSVHKSRKTKHDCAICDLGFRKLSDLNSHYKYEHPIATEDIDDDDLIILPKSLRIKKEKQI